MVVQPDFKMEWGLAHHIAVLQHCIEVLRQRVAEDAEYSWLWTAKLKAACFGLRMLKGSSHPQSSVPTVSLSADELNELAQTHPLLLNDRFASSPIEARRQADWYRDLQERVRRFARRWN
jgi:hypothetical protein